ncbi:MULTISPECIES: hypothetical protein [unclassified Bacillus (in: firmicutes)]|uniref:hypothetical protein n=1 Tax=unclassified Bacillus (in: firmicutes) TaxID=185979 RepID=UPI002282B8C8|nr:hypothetical protein [Bacillus sp. S20C3]MCY8290298.1 hypothetical protein [Bacillus sp. N13C7]MCY8637687.1 hypothetical protein [Bacillus sp. S17B2]MCY9144754.1 hypothetical protein [Bacillus sp. T9C1]
MVLLNITWEQVSQFISNIFNSKFVTIGITSWPLAAVIIALSFKKGIIEILKNRKVQVEAGGGNGVKVVVDEVLETTKVNLKEASKKVVKDDKAVIDIPVFTMLNNQQILEAVVQKALIDPVRTIEDIWSDFLKGLENITTFVEDNTDLTFEGDTFHVMDVLLENKKISKQAADAIKGLFIISQSVENDSMKVKINERPQFAKTAREYYISCVQSLELLRTELSKSLASEDLQS